MSSSPAQAPSLKATLQDATEQLLQAKVAFGHGTSNAHDEATWLVLWQLGLPLDSDLNSVGSLLLSPEQTAQVRALISQRISSRKPAAYLTHEAWLQGIPFYVDERVIVPRSFIAEVLAEGSIDPWLSEQTLRVLDLCTGNGSLAVLAALAYPEVTVVGADISPDALDVARINIERHQLQDRVTLVQSDGLANVRSPADPRFDLILCNPPYVNAQSMASLPAEYQAEPVLALAGGSDGMDFIRRLLKDAPAHMSQEAVLVLEVGNEREHFEAAFAKLEVVWLDTSAGNDQVLLVTRDAMMRHAEPGQPG